MGKYKRHQKLLRRLEGQRTPEGHRDTAGPTWSPSCTTRSRRQQRPGTPCTSSTGCRQPPSPVSSAQQQHSCFQRCHSPRERPPSTATSSRRQDQRWGWDPLTLELTHPARHGSRPWHSVDAGAVPWLPSRGVSPSSRLLPTEGSWSPSEPGAMSPQTGRMP